ncbi:stAR-related lipid transfer protein 13-like isoform X1 [Rhopilema esculentum]|uniref:stAR-related lipid transfer protein 13-like isoform X1 n=2 Tax=Rhopilema esculentum TaxID=499914 RepID=UPI0031D98960
MTSSEDRQPVSECKKKILEYKWEKIRKKILEDCLWQVTKDELEALEACYWLKATGFQEYVHLYDDQQFPVDISLIQKDHVSMDEDSRHSLIRRLETLNRCAKLTKKRVKNLALRKANLSSRADPLCSNQLFSQQCSASSMDHIKSSNSSSSLLVEMHGRKRPSSKYGIYSVDRAVTDVDTVAKDIGIPGQEPRLSRTFSFSGTSESNDLASNASHLTSASTTDVFSKENRLSFYDNVPILADSEPNYKYIGASPTDSVFKESVPMRRKHFASQMESDDDMSSVSSPEDDEDLETAERLSLAASSSKGMGSVDSGVPSSPVLRSPSVRQRRVKWHSFQKSTDGEAICLSLKMQNLSAGQMVALRKISLLRLTALMERYSVQNRSGWHWTIPKLLRRLRSPENRGERNVFGASLLTTVQRSGHPLPRSILLCIAFLTRTALSTVGIFRRSGVKSRIEKLKEDIELFNSKLAFDSYSPYDIADMLKQYLRELPEPLLTSKLAETFIAIYKDIPKELQKQAMKLAIILMPDENREALQTILAFLNQFASNSNENQMDHRNLSVCFAPAFFHIFGTKDDKGNNAKRLRRTFSSVKSEKDFEDIKATQQCLIDLMQTFHDLFTVPEDVMMKCRFTYIEQGDPVFLEDLSSNLSEANSEDGYQTYLENCFSGLLQESQSKTKGWMQHSINSDVEVSYKTVKDGYPIKLWKAVVEINASPTDILRRFVKERHLWDDEMVSWEYIENLDDQTDIFYCETQTIVPSVKRDYLTLRSWRKCLNGSSCGCVTTSINHRSVHLSSGIRAIVLADRCLMEPLGLGRSKVTYICRTDLRGKSPRYYNKAIGPWLVFSCVTKIRDTFNCGPDGPETNV